MTIEQWLAKATKKLHDSPSAQLDAQLLMMHVLDMPKTWLFAHGNEVIEEKQLHESETLLKRRLEHEPVAYLTGHREFYGRTFIVTPAVLVPRPETEDMVELAKKHGLSGRLLDVGTGSGCVGLTLARETSSRLTVCDISENALDVARKNAKRLGVKPVRFVKSDLLAHWLSHSRPKLFDVIAANLPYVDASWNDTSPELKHEPDVALYADDRGVALIKTLIDQAPRLLSKQGYLLLEADPSQHAEIIRYANTFQLIDTLGYALLFQKTS